MLGTKVLEEKASKFNGKIRVLSTLGMGTYIQAGGITQSGGIVFSIWRQTLKKIKSKKIEVKKCLILGLGGGTASKLVKKYWPNTQITGVEIDPVMVELGKKYLDLGKNKAKIKIMDAAKFSSKEKYDLIITDLYHGDNFPKKFSSNQFFKRLCNLSTEDGVIIFNRLYYGEKKKEAKAFVKKLEKYFPNLEWYFPQANAIIICTVKMI